VEIFIFSVDISFNNLCKIVVFHEPVGQVINIIPFSECIAFRSCFSILGGKLESFIVKVLKSCLNSLKTTFSQLLVGNVLTLISNICHHIANQKEPS
jgi:hypothetical protein